ncbi:unknown protein [Nostoc sp. NIES-3756]|jgi:hypothetical protein|uniref:hypothetical protein n=1 Tax=Nostoc sp. NIES-3756 TaxID=1751286 RepID=UPI000720C72D|nr:hypothetical protein [Nostoc sp. NIES-3756]BAT54229.1 unknown protein [Nostoc sp. NIES-3756]BAY38030.1 hypothetical protein NIES2111_23740 [Nostoc sp. NIES-2111]
MDIRLIKKSEKLVLKKIKMMEETEEENLSLEPLDTPEPIVDEQKELYIDIREAKYIPVRDNPVIQSVGNSGWQVSDIWRDIRVDDFCN